MVTTPAAPGRFILSRRGAARREKEDSSMKTTMSEFEDPRKARALRAMMGLVNRQLRVIPFVAGKLWTVESSMSGKPREYTVAHGVVPGFTWACTCPDWQKRHEDCKHILAVRLLVEQQV